VRDTGIGIPPDKLGQLFQSFSQLDASTTREYGGTGLGLAISKRLAELMGGTMWAESDGVVGRGATFHFTIVSEVADEREASAEPQATSASDDRPLAVRLPLRILLTEDVAVNRKFALLALEDLGYTADVAVNGQEAVAATHQQPYDVILMDVQMPIVDGLEATRRIRTGQNRSARSYIIAMTANAMQGDRELCLEAGMDDYISKPVYMEELQAALERAGQSLTTAGASYQQRPAERFFPEDIG
jgi:CheY-like chemotaxis protein